MKIDPPVVMTGQSVGEREMILATPNPGNPKGGIAVGQSNLGNDSPAVADGDTDGFPLTGGQPLGELLVHGGLI